MLLIWFVQTTDGKIERQREKMVNECHAKISI